MSNFHTLKIKELIKQTSDSVSITFEIPSNLKQEYSFVSGQYITIEQEIKGETIRRAYSIWKAPHENELSVLVKQIENGLFSTFANNQLREGDSLKVMTPQGNFKHNTNSENQKTYNLFAAGSGITPIISIAKEILAEEKNSKVNLYYVNKSTNSTIFKKELEEMSSQNFSLYNFYTRESQSNSLFEGRMDTQKLNDLVNSDTLYIKDKFFMCGPEKMILDIKEFLESKNVNKDNIHFELFTTSESKSEEEVPSNIEIGNVHLIIDDDEFHYEYKIAKSDSLLDAGISKGLDLPYSCKGGVCCTCKAKVLEGKAKMKINYALSEDEVANGYILTCQAHPITPTIKVSFDD